MKKILLLGSNGQLGWELCRTKPDNILLSFLDYPEIDFCNFGSIAKHINAVSPDCIINAAAYTNVDKAEKESLLAYKVNHEAVCKIAKMCKENKIFMIQISTDFVFSGKNSIPYKPEDEQCPESIYGKSKSEGEKAVRKILRNNALIIRTAWLYSSHGNNFVKTMLKFMKEKKSLSIVDDQIGTPTWAFGLAKTIWTAVSKKLYGGFHFTDAGIASWYDFAIAIQEEGLKAGLLDNVMPIIPIPTAQYPTPAKRPMYSVLDKTSTWQTEGIIPTHWCIQLRSMLRELDK